MLIEAFFGPQEDQLHEDFDPLGLDLFDFSKDAVVLDALLLRVVLDRSVPNTVVEK